LDAYPTGAPPTPVFDHILRILFTEEEVDVALHMNFLGSTAEEIAVRAALPVEEVRERLERMADKVIIFSREVKGKRVYGLLPAHPRALRIPLHEGRRHPHA